MADIWLSRILAVECPDCVRFECGGKQGDPCNTVEYHSGRRAPMFCASRIQAAEDAAKASESHEFHRTRDVNTNGWWHEMYLCSCGLQRKPDGAGGWLYSLNGATWTPGPAPCPGRPSTPEPGKP